MGGGWKDDRQTVRIQSTLDIGDPALTKWFWGLISGWCWVH